MSLARENDRLVGWLASMTVWRPSSALVANPILIYNSWPVAAAAPSLTQLKAFPKLGWRTRAHQNASSEALPASLSRLLLSLLLQVQSA